MWRNDKKQDGMLKSKQPSFLQGWLGKIKGHHAAMSLFCALILPAVLGCFMLAVHFLVREIHHFDIQRAIRAETKVALSSYDRRLWRDFKLFALPEQDLKAQVWFKYLDNPEGISFTIKGKNLINDPQILKALILSQKENFTKKSKAWKYDVEGENGLELFLKAAKEALKNFSEADQGLQLDWDKQAISEVLKDLFSEAALAKQSDFFFNSQRMNAFLQSFSAQENQADFDLAEKDLIVHYILLYFNRRVQKQSENGQEVFLKTPNGQLLSELPSLREEEIEKIIQKNPVRENLMLDEDLIDFLLLKNYINFRQQELDLTAINHREILIQAKEETKKDLLKIEAGELLNFSLQPGNSYGVRYGDFLAYFLKRMPSEDLLDGIFACLENIMPYPQYSSVELQLVEGNKTCQMQGSYLN